MEPFVPLICPTHHTELQHHGAADSAYHCSFGCTFPIVANIPRFVEKHSYADAFGMQWNQFRKTQLDSYTKTTISHDRLKRLLGGDLSIVHGKTVLEAGCGAGRFTEVLLQYGAKVFASDISSAVVANYQNHSTYKDFFVCQADLQELPTPPNIFDIVICIGVLQHTPDTKLSIARLISYLKPGGLLVIDHYSTDYSVSRSRRLLRSLFLGLKPEQAMRSTQRLVRILWPLHIFFHQFAHIPILWRLYVWLIAISPVVDFQEAYPQLSTELLKQWAILDTHDTLTDHYKHLLRSEDVQHILDNNQMQSIQVSIGGNGIEARAIK